MSKALAFLAKKSWHTGTIKNMDRVWNAEQEKAAEDKKILELQRELERERSRKQLLDAKKGGSDNSGRECLEWMYRSVMSSTTTEDELNKPFVAEEEKEDLTTPSLLQQKAVNATQDDWSKVMEDPLLQIKQQEQDALQAIAKNPLKMKEIMEKLEDRQRHKKAKKAKKAHKHRKHSRRHASRSPSPHTIGKRSRHSERSSRRRESSYSPSPSRKRRRSRSPARREDSYRRRHDSSERPSRREVESPRRDRDRYRERESRSRRSHSPVKRARSPARRERSPARRERSPSRRERCAIRRERSPVQPERSPARQREAPVRVAPSRVHPSRRSRVSGLSEEEKRRRLAEMEEAGRANYEGKLARYQRNKEELAREKNELHGREQESVDKEGNFLHDLKAEVYMGKDVSMEERLGRNRHYLQRDEQ